MGVLTNITEQSSIENASLKLIAAGVAKDNILLLQTSWAGGTNLGGTFRKPGVTSGYQIPASKQLRVLGVVLSEVGGSNTTMSLQQTDNDIGLDAAASGFVNPVDFMSGTLQNIAAGTFNQRFEFNFVVPTGKYISGRCGGTASGINRAVLIGILEDA